MKRAEKSRERGRAYRGGRENQPSIQAEEGRDHHFEVGSHRFSRRKRLGGLCQGVLAQLRGSYKRGEPEGRKKGRDAAGWTVDRYEATFRGRRKLTELKGDSARPE